MTSIRLFAFTFFVASSFAATPAGTAIQQSLASIAKQPAHYPYYNDLAMAYARRARETADLRFFSKADEATQKSLAIEPDNFEARKMQTWIQLARGEFSQALESATRLNKQVPDDVSVYGYLVDANVALGNDQEAIDAAQWMLNLRPGNVPGLLRAARLRQLHGILPGALELLETALDATPPAETEDRAWILTQMAHLHLVSGDLAQAEMSANRALKLFPDYPHAQDALAEVRISQGRYADAVELLRQRDQAASLYALAEAQELAGRKEDAQASYRKFESMALADHSKRELIAYYLDHAGNPAKALEIARQEMTQRHDVYTRDAYAWALAANGDYAAANREIQAVLALGIEDPKILFHAGSIELHLHATDKATVHLKDAAARHSREAAALLGTME